MTREDARFCGNSHRVRATQEANRLRELLEQLLSRDAAVIEPLLVGLATERREAHLDATTRAVAARLRELRPDERIDHVFEVLDARLSARSR